MILNFLKEWKDQEFYNGVAILDNNFAKSNIKHSEIDKYIEKEELINGKIEKVKQHHLENLFKFLLNYLNGSNGLDQLDNQPLIILLSGGNIFSIYKYLLQKIFTINSNDIDIDNIDIKKFINKYFKEITLEKHPNSYEKLVYIISCIHKIYSGNSINNYFFLT